MPPRSRKPIHPALHPEFLSGFSLSSNVTDNLRKLAADYVSDIQQIKRNNATMERRGEFEMDLKAPWSNSRIDTHVRRQKMRATLDALDATLGHGAGKRFRNETLKAYDLEDEDGEDR